MCWPEAVADRGGEGANALGAGLLWTWESGTCPPALFGVGEKGMVRHRGSTMEEEEEEASLAHIVPASCQTFKPAPALHLRMGCWLEWLYLHTRLPTCLPACPLDPMNHEVRRVPGGHTRNMKRPCWSTPSFWPLCLQKGPPKLSASFVLVPPLLAST